MSLIKKALPVFLLFNGLSCASYVADLTDYNTDPEIFAGILTTIVNRDLKDSPHDAPTIWPLSFASDIWNAIDNLEKEQEFQQQQNQILNSRKDLKIINVYPNCRSDMDLIIMKAEEKNFSDSGEDSTATESPNSFRPIVSREVSFYNPDIGGVAQQPIYYTLYQAGSNTDFLGQFGGTSLGDTCESTCDSVGPYSEASVIIDEGEDLQPSPAVGIDTLLVSELIGLDAEPSYVLITDEDLTDPSLLESKISINVQSFIEAPKHRQQLVKYDQDILSVISRVLTKVTGIVFFNDLLGIVSNYQIDPELYPREYDFHENCKAHEIYPLPPLIPFENYPQPLQIEDIHKRFLINPDNRISRDDYQYCQDILYFSEEKTFNEIGVDIPRLPQKYLDAYQKMNSIVDLSPEHKERLQDELLSLLSYILVTKKPEDVQFSEYDVAEFDVLANFNEELTADPQPLSPSYDKMLYFQGFDSVAAYFLVQYGLEAAGPIAFKFFHLFLKDIVNIPESELSTKVRSIDDRAIRIVREYLKHESSKSSKATMDMNIALGILEHYPFSHRSATVAYFNSAKTFEDLDMLVQFMIAEVPREKAHLAISLLAASNMYFSAVAFDALFTQELGNENWSYLKVQLNKQPDSDTFYELASMYMGNIFILYSDQLSHSGQKMADFLNVARDLLLYMDS